MNMFFLPYLLRLFIAIAVHNFDPDCSISESVKWIAVKFGTDTHLPQKTNRDDFDPLTSVLLA